MIRLWAHCRVCAVFLFVVWNLLFLAARNTLELWLGPEHAWAPQQTCGSVPEAAIHQVDRITEKYANFVGCEQRWAMFRPPLDRHVSFLAIRFEFTDGSTELARSTNEPDLNNFLRIGGCRARRLEEYLLSPPSQLDQHPEWPLWESSARFALTRWREDHPADLRQPRRVVFLCRRFTLPVPGRQSDAPGKPDEQVLVAFDPDGRLSR